MISVSMSALANATLIQAVIGLFPLTPTEVVVLVVVAVAAVIGTLAIRRERHEEITARLTREPRHTEG